ncbi:MAG: ectoine synthase [Pseudomonadota bacterium]
MIVRNLNEAIDTDRRVVSPDGNWESVRLVLRDDRVGFSFHITTVYANTEFAMHYQHHQESVYCLSGNGEVENLDDGNIYPVNPGTIYVLDQNDRHIFRAFSEVKIACVFNPPVVGNEVHNSEGAYELHD